MRKGITSFLLGAVAAVLLAIPTQAAGVQKDLTIKARPTFHATKNLASNLTVGKKVAGEMLLRQADNKLAKLTDMQKAILAKQTEVISFKQGKAPWQKRISGKALKVDPMNNLRGVQLTPYSSPALARGPIKNIDETEVVDENGIIVKPAEGEHKFYQRTGMSYYVSGNQIYTTAQQGVAEIVETPDGRVYFKDFIYPVQQGTWVKGSKVGNTITIPAGQVIYFNTEENYGLYIGRLSYDENNENNPWAQVEGDITLTIDGDVISLDDTDEDNFVALFWTDDFSFSGYGDYQTVFTYKPGYVPPTLVEIPADATIENWFTEGATYDSQTQGDVPFTGKADVAFVGDDVYVRGFFSDFPNSWIKGTINGTTVTFPKLQFLGVYGGSYDIYATSAQAVDEQTVELADIVMEYDAVAKTLTATNDIIANAATDRIYYLQYITALTIMANDPSNVVIEELPYLNDFNDSKAQSQFTIVDANEDGSTWKFSNGTVNYLYNSNNDADDWLFSPAIKLEAGKTYRAAFDVSAYSSRYPERVEMKIGTEKNAEAMTATVIEPTDVNWGDPLQTLENKAITVSETGYYIFGIHAISDADQYFLYLDNFIVEEGADPAAPAAVTDLTIVPSEEAIEATLSFTAPSKAINGEDLTENLSKIEIYRDGELIYTFEDVTPGTALTYLDNAEDLTIGTHTYRIIAYNAAGIGDKSEEVSVAIIPVLSVPQNFDLTNEGVFDLFQVIDANGGSTWKWSANYGAYYLYDSTLQGDDYLISPAIKMEAGKNYNVIVEALTAGYPEKFQVLVGKEPTPEALNIVAIDEVTFEEEEATVFENEFIINESGNYYIAIKATSDPDMWRLQIKSLVVEIGADPNAPAAIDDLAVSAGAEGALEANINFTAPAKAINGSDLTENMSFEILRGGEVINTIQDVAPAATVTWQDASIEKSAFYTYQVIPYNSLGRGKKSDKITLFVGLDIPKQVEEVAYKDNGTSIDFNWSRVPDTGINGGYVNTAKVDYLVWSMELVDFMGWFTYLEYDEKLDSLRDATNTTIQFNTDEGEQGYKYFGVQTKNEAGTADDCTTIGILAGAPYDLPIVEGFTGASLHYIWVSENCNLYISNDASDGDGVALKMCADEAGLSAFVSGKLNLKSAANPSLVFDARSGSNNNVFVIGCSEDNDVEILGEATIGEEYSTVKVPLNSIQNGRYAQVGIATTIVNPNTQQYDFETGDFVTVIGDSLIIDNIRIVDLYEYDLSVSLSAPKNIVAGKSANIDVTVKNEGEQPAAGYTVKLFADDTALLDLTANEILAPFVGETTISATLPTSIFDEAKDITLRAEVVFDNDLNEDNNIAEAILTLTEPTAAAPTDVTAVQEEPDADVILNWLAPSSAAAEIVEDFEDPESFPEFSIGGITAEQPTGSLGEWTLYDGNGTMLYGFNGITVPNLGPAAAWMVFAPSSSQLSTDMSTNYPSHSGKQYLASFCTAEPDGNIAPTDHWLISPELPGIAQTISFFTRELVTDYGAETYEILYSTTGKEITDFQLLASAQVSSTQWEQVSYDLPEGTKFFAIRHTSQDVWGLMVDDITYTAGGTAPVAYNIYVDAELNGDVEGDVTTYRVDVSNILSGNHSFAVSALYANGAESKPAIATITIITAINEIVATGKPVNIYTMDGKHITSLKGQKGAYIINNKKVLVK